MRPTTKALSAILLAGMLSLPATATAAILNVNCPGEKLQVAVDLAQEGDTIIVHGTCPENITIGWDKLNLRLDGEPSGVIQAPDTAQPAVIVLARQAILQGLTITGGLDGIQVVRGASAIINKNTIDGAARYGIVLTQNANGFIVNNEIRNCPAVGLVVADSSYAAIGILATTDTVAQRNNIHGNGVGILVGRASARIVGNTVSYNAGDGIQVSKNGQADIADNQIDANGSNGIWVGKNSGADLGYFTGGSPLDRPNYSVAPNGGMAVLCTTGGYVGGQLGTLAGSDKKKPASFSKDCVDALSR